MKRRTDWWRPLGGLNECSRLSAIVTTRLCLCDVSQCASMSIRGPLLNCMADSRRLSRTRTHTHTHAPQRPFLKSLPPLDKPSGMLVICPCRCLNLGPALVSSGGGTLLRHRYDTVSLHTGLDSGQGRGQALRPRRQSGAVNGCLSWQIDHPPDPPALNLQDQCAYLDPLCASCVYVV